MKVADNYVLSFIMAGGRGSRLEILTKDRSKPSVSILGHYRIFDFVATNVQNTGISTMLIATQFEPETLSMHIGSGEVWGFNNNTDNKLEILYPHEKGRNNIITYEGTADSVRKNSDRIDRYDPNVILILGGDHIYNMDYTESIKFHIENDADITIMTNVIPESKVKDFGVVSIDESCRIIDFAEKPTDREVIERFKLPSRIKELLGIKDPNLNYLASMGNYVFFWDRLKSFLNCSGNDFGKDIIPAMKECNLRLYAYVFDGYWRDVGRIIDYFDCNMDFVGKNKPIDFTKCKIKTNERKLPGPWIGSDTILRDVILSAGDVINDNCFIAESVLGYQVTIDEGCRLNNCVLLGATKNEFYGNQIRKQYTTRIGKGSILSHVIIDKNVWVGEGVNIGPHNGTPEERVKLLQNAGLKPYRELPDGTFEGDFSIEPQRGILVIRKQYNCDPKKPLLPDGLVA